MFLAAGQEVSGPNGASIQRNVQFRISRNTLYQAKLSSKAMGVVGLRAGPTISGCWPYTIQKIMGHQDMGPDFSLNFFIRGVPQPVRTMIPQTVRG